MCLGIHTTSLHRCFIQRNPSIDLVKLNYLSRNQMQSTFSKATFPATTTIQNNHCFSILTTSNSWWDSQLYKIQ